MRRPGVLSAEDATPGDLRRSMWGLLATLVLLVVLVVPLIRALPLGPSPRTAILAWLLVALALYWLYASMGYWPLLIFQLLMFSSAAALLTVKVGLVVLDIHRLPMLRHSAKVLILVGAAFAGANLGGMVMAHLRWRRELRRLLEPGKLSEGSTTHERGSKPS